MSLEKSLFIIKPEAFDQKEDIKKYVTMHSDLKILGAEIMTLTEKDVEHIYIDDAGTDLLDAAKKHLAGKQVEVCIVEGESAVEVLWNLTGKSFNGDICDPGTLRYIFGRMGTVQYDSVVYYLNAVHKTTPHEVEPALSWLASRIK